MLVGLTITMSSLAALRVVVDLLEVSRQRRRMSPSLVCGPAGSQ